MNKTMNWWTKLGCKLTGWSSNVLEQCSEASKCQLSKYTSALLILILIWGVTGFCFAQRYIGLPWWACGFISLFFITIVIMIHIVSIYKKFLRISFLNSIGVIRHDGFIFKIIKHQIFYASHNNYSFYC